ncbi:HEPN domain-containing protein [Candidatus Dojkabacteria bacterium]|nr:HEPN domain-containing protein [Candidatus Dojkabacteria bacterium]
MKGERYKTWLKQAEFDLQAAKLSLENGFNEWAAYQSEQTVEKALKAVIVHAGETSPKIHKLSVLFGMCNSVNKEFRNTKFQFHHIESFGFISRYPFLLPGKDKSPHELISRSEAEAGIKEAENIIESIKMILGKGLQKNGDKMPGSIGKEELDRRLDEIRTILISEFQPERIVVFGSYAREPLPDKLSTIDILIIAKSELTFIERIKRAREVTRGELPAIEPLVYTPEEFKILTEIEGESFFESALVEGREIYPGNEH